MATIMSLSANAAVARPAAGRAAAQRRTAPTVRASAAPDNNKGVQQVAKGSSKAVSMGRRDAVLFGSSALQLLVASKAWALIPGNDDEDEE